MYMPCFTIMILVEKLIYAVVGRRALCQGNQDVGCLPNSDLGLRMSGVSCCREYHVMRAHRDTQIPPPSLQIDKTLCYIRK